MLTNNCVDESKRYTYFVPIDGINNIHSMA